jgi:hypothetical protein
MQDVTNTHLEAALIDQKVAGALRGHAYAFVAVVADGGWQLGVAVQDEPGYIAVKGKSFVDHDEAKQWADSLNKHVGLTADAAIEIVCSSMRRKVRGKR